MVEMIKDIMDLRRNLIFLPLRILAAFVDAAVFDQVRRDRNPSIAFKARGSG